MEIYKKTSSMEWESGKVEGFSKKDLLEMANGNLKLIKVDGFATYLSHLHPKKTEFVFVVDGNPRINVGKNTYESVKGDFIILPEDIMHSIHNPDEVECMLLTGSIHQ